MKIMNNKTPYFLTKDEREYLRNWYLSYAEYNSICACKQEEMSIKADSNTTEIFTQSLRPNFLLDGELQTPENWLKRRDNFLFWAKNLRDRAEYFK